MVMPYNTEHLDRMMTDLSVGIIKNLAYLVDQYGVNKVLNLSDIPHLSVIIFNSDTNESEIFTPDYVIHDKQMQFYENNYSQYASELPIEALKYLHDKIVAYYSKLEQSKDDPLVVTILFGEAACHLLDEFMNPESELHEKYDSFQEVLDGEHEGYLYRHMRFNTEAEKLAYLQGIEDMDGWSGFEIIDGTLDLH